MRRFVDAVFVGDCAVADRLTTQRLKTNQGRCDPDGLVPPEQRDRTDYEVAPAEVVGQRGTVQVTTFFEGDEIGVYSLRLVVRDAAWRIDGVRRGPAA